MQDARGSLRARYRDAWATGRLVSGFISGALFGFLFIELGVPLIIRWHYEMLDVLLFALVAAGASIFTRFLRALWVLDIVVFLFICVIAQTPVMTSLTTAWMRADSLPPGGVDAVVVMSSGVTSGRTLEVTAADRLLAGLELTRAGVAPRLVTSRVMGTRPDVTSDADQRRLIGLAGLADKWLLPPNLVFSTREEALEIDQRLRGLGATRIAVVTSPLHTRRACAVFEADGMRAICRPAPERGDQTLRPQEYRDRLGAFRTYLYERIGWLVYRMHGWVK